MWFGYLFPFTVHQYQCMSQHQINYLCPLLSGYSPHMLIDLLRSHRETESFKGWRWWKQNETLSKGAVDNNLKPYVTHLCGIRRFVCLSPFTSRYWLQCEDTSSGQQPGSAANVGYSWAGKVSTRLSRCCFLLLFFLYSQCSSTFMRPVCPCYHLYYGGFKWSLTHHLLFFSILLVNTKITHCHVTKRVSDVEKRTEILAINVK